MNLDRRRLLAACGAAGAAILAGCSGDPLAGSSGTATPTPSPTGPPESRFVTDDAVVDYPGMVDGAATVEPDGEAHTIEYADPEQGFRLLAGFEGDTDPSELRVSRDLAVDARAGFVTPIYDADAGEFVYQVFANEAFVEYTDWNFVTVEGDGSLTGEGAVPFERVQGSVYAAGITPGEVRRLFVVDSTAETLRAEGPGTLSGLVVLVGRSDTDTPAEVPRAQFHFEYAGETGELTITHDGGDTIPDDDRLLVRTGDRGGSWETPVRAGDRRSVTAPSNATVRIVWESGSADRSATLAEWTGPDA